MTVKDNLPFIRRCSNDSCNRKLEEGDIVYQEYYYYCLFCSAECLIDWSAKEYGWAVGKLEKVKEGRMSDEESEEFNPTKGDY